MNRGSIIEVPESTPPTGRQPLSAKVAQDHGVPMEPVASIVVDATQLDIDMEKAIRMEERHYQYLSRGMVHLPDGNVEITEEQSAMIWPSRMAALAKRIADTDERATKLSPAPRRIAVTSEPIYELTTLGKEVAALCDGGVMYIEEAYPGCRLKETAFMCMKNAPTPHEPKTKLEPSIAVMLRACQRLRALLASHGYPRLDVNQKRFREAAERLVRFVRRVCRSRRFKYLQQNAIRSAEDKFPKYCQYMGAQFETYSKLLILRVDLYFLPEAKGWANTDDAQACFKRFKRALREGRIVPDVVAWIAKRENGFRRGVHMHLMVALDGHKHQSAAALSKMVGEKWRDQYSDNKGSYFNCYARKDLYHRNGLGMVHSKDVSKLLGIREAIRYLTKSDCQVTTGYKRNLWCGMSRESEASVKRGAPRKAGHDMSAVTEILMGA